MSDPQHTATADDEQAAESGSFPEGRYLYCVVSTDADGDFSPSISGIDDGDPYLIEHDGVGVVVQSCESPYESTDMETVKQWLMQHQAVIDDAAEAYGTPLPFRFDTILKGGDEQVEDWLAEASSILTNELENLAGQWEYRIELVWDRTAFEYNVSRKDDRLSELREKRQEAAEGTSFLIDKQYDKRLQELIETRQREETEAVLEQLRTPASEVREVDRKTTFLDDERSSAGDQARHSIAVLAPEEREDEIGDVLDDLATEPAVQIRFTGPWPPYSFSPALEGEL